MHRTQVGRVARVPGFHRLIHAAGEGAAIVGLTSLLFTGGCGSNVGGAREDAGVDAGVDASATPACTAGTDGCIPSRPAASTSDAADAMDMSYALRDVLLTQTNPGPPEAQPWRYIGSDLDGIDTATSSDPNGCMTMAAVGGSTPVDHVDGVAGIDNQFGAQLATTLFPVIAPNLQNDLCCMQSQARGTIMLRVREWNGEADDAHVVLSLTTSYDGTSESVSAVEWDARPAGTRSNGYVKVGTTTPADRPAWTPDTDTWFTNASDLTANDVNAPRHVDTNGYVAKGYLVMELNGNEAVKLYLGHQNAFVIGLQQGTLVAHLTSNRHLIDAGWLAGRMTGTALGDATARLRANELYSSDFLCTNDPTYVGTCPGDDTDNATACSASAGVITPLVAALADVLADGTNNPATPCDALSVGVSFRGVRAKAVVSASASLVLPQPDCGGLTGVLGTTTTQETSACPYGASPVACDIRAWNPAD